MQCPRCRDRHGSQSEEGKTAHVSTGSLRLDYIIACYSCSWQVPIRELESWLKRWGYRK